VKCEGVAGAANDACIEVILKEIVVEIGKPGKSKDLILSGALYSAPCYGQTLALPAHIRLVITAVLGVFIKLY
jgi:hypothetical protein